MKKLNVRSKQVVAMVLFFVMTITAIQLPSFAAIDSLDGNTIPAPQANVAAGEVETGTQVALTCSNPMLLFIIRKMEASPVRPVPNIRHQLPFIKIQQ